jgi:hypothetical protein
VVIQQDPGTGNFAFEISNQEANRDAEPRTAPRIANVTAIGGSGSKSGGLKLKEGTAGEFYNTIVTGFNNAGVELTEEQTEAQADAGNITIENSLFSENARSGGDLYVVSDGSTFDLQGLVEAESNGNLFDVDPMLGSTAWGSPDFAPAADSPVHNGVTPPSGFAAAAYIGAVESSESDWTLGWTSYATN